MAVPGRDRPRSCPLQPRSSGREFSDRALRRDGWTGLARSPEACGKGWSGAVTLAALLFDHPRPAQEPLLHSATETMNAADAQTDADAVASRLRAEGIEPGQGVAVQ